MNLKEIEERVEKGLRNELPEALTWDQCKQLISRVKELEKLPACDYSGVVKILQEENSKLKAERDRYKELGAVLENKSSNLEVEVEQLHDALKIADEAFKAIVVLPTISASRARQKIKETLGEE